MLQGRTVPAWIALCLVIFSVSSVTFAAATVATITFNKPYVVEISFASPQLKVEGARLSDYNTTSNTYPSCIVTVKNYYTDGSVGGTVYAKLLDSDGKTVATGSTVTGNVQAQTTKDVTIPLTWTAGKTMENVASGRISVIES
jgi:uncharacterized membrane protein